MIASKRSQYFAILLTRKDKVATKQDHDKDQKRSNTLHVSFFGERLRKNTEHQF